MPSKQPRVFSDHTIDAEAAVGQAVFSGNIPLAVAMCDELIANNAPGTDYALERVFNTWAHLRETQSRFSSAIDFIMEEARARGVEGFDEVRHKEMYENVCRSQVAGSNYPEAIRMAEQAEESGFEGLKTDVIEEIKARITHTLEKADELIAKGPARHREAERKLGVADRIARFLMENGVPEAEEILSVTEEMRKSLDFTVSKSPNRNWKAAFGR